jgi:hypothetical protein
MLYISDTIVKKAIGIPIGMNIKTFEKADVEYEINKKYYDSIRMHYLLFAHHFCFLLFKH